MIFLQIYLITCIPALGTLIYSIWDDIRCHRGLSKPDSKFGYHWQWPEWFGFTQILMLLQITPVANLFFGWYLYIGLTYDHLTKK